MDETQQKRTKAGHKAQVTVQLGKANEIIHKDFKDCTKRDICILTTTVADIKGRIETIRELDEKLLAVIKDDTTFANTFALFEQYRIEINESVTAFTTYLEDYKESQKPSSLDTSLSGSSSGSTTGSGGSSRKVNLPKLQLATFNGDILQWQEFYDGFSAAIDKDDSLENIQKFQYLRTQLRGEAAKCIEGLTLTNANYDQALGLLKDRYGQPFKIQDAYMKALWNLSLPSEDRCTTQDLRKFYDNMESHIRSLEALGKTSDSYGDLLVHVLQDRIPANVKQTMAREHKSTTWKLDEFRKGLKTEIDALEAGAKSPSNIQCSSDSIGITTQSFHTNIREVIRQELSAIHSQGAGEVGIVNSRIVGDSRNSGTQAFFTNAGTARPARRKFPCAFVSKLAMLPKIAE